MSLYNEFRPHSLADVKGQGNVVAQIRGIIATGNIPNVSLFVGPRGTGKTTVARIFAKSINCEHSSTETGSCNQCKSCRDIDSGVSIDVIELDAASHNKVDDVHGIIDGSLYTPIGKYKVYIIDEVHMLSTAAFNALLKLLEEPPSYCKFILCTTEQHKVPVTIMSRCRKFYFERIDLSEVSDKLISICESKDIHNYDLDAIHTIAKKSDGCMRDAESLLECFIDSKCVTKEAVANILGTADEESVSSILSGLFGGNFDVCYTSVKNYQKRGMNLHLLVHSLMEYIADIVYVLQAGCGTALDGTASYEEAIVALSKLTTVSDCIRYMNELGEIFTLSQKGAATDFLIESRLLSMMSVSSSQSTVEKNLEAFSGRLEAVENALYDVVLPSGAISGSSGDYKTSIESTSGTVFDEDFPPVDIPTEITSSLDGFDAYHEPDVSFQINAEVEEREEIADQGQRATQQLMNNDAAPSVPSFGIDGVLPGDINLPKGVKVLGSIDLSTSLNTLPDLTNSSEESNHENMESSSFEDEAPVSDESPKSFDSADDSIKSLVADTFSDMSDVPIFGTLFDI